MKNFMNYDFNIDKIVIACFVPSSTAKLNHRNRSSHGLAFNISGEKSSHFHGYGTVTFGINDILYMPKHSDYDSFVHVEGDCYAINFDIEEDVNFKPFVFHVKNAAGIFEHFKRANTVWNQNIRGAEMKCKAELYNIIYMMQKEFEAGYMPGEKYKIIAPAVDMIHKNYSQVNLSIAELSALCNISPEYFRNIFKNHFGVSPLAYINNLKITKAKELLLSGMYSVTQVALVSGYSDMSHFSREFKKAFGISPSKYKKVQP